MRAVPGAAAVAILAFAVAGCASVVDSGQARICRAILPALNAPNAVIDIARVTALRSDDGVRIAYRARTPSGLTRDRLLECRYAAAGYASPERRGLIAVTTEDGPIGDLRLQILKRFWLEKEGVAVDPEPVRNAADAPEVPRGLAETLQHVISAVPPTAIYALLATAYSLLYGLVGRINFAFGELAAVGGYAAFLALALVGPERGLAPALAFALMLTLAAAVIHGIAAGRFVFAPLMRRTGQQMLIGTLALALVLQEYLRLAQGSRLLWVQPVLNTPYAVARAGDFLVTLTPIALAVGVLCLVAALALVLLIKFTRFGRAWRACADDPLAAELFGVDRRRLLVETFAIASGLAGLAGYVVTIYYGTFGYAGGIVIGLKSLIAAIVGGIGSVPGALLGGILIGGAEAAWSALFPIEFRELAIYVLLVILMLFRPHGLFGFGEPLPPKV
jgi:branched-chain amino acid transport system permease protein